MKEGDEGFKIEVVATATNDNGGAVSQTSAATAAVIDERRRPSTTPVSSPARRTKVRRLTASATAGDSDDAVSYQWMENSGSGDGYRDDRRRHRRNYLVKEGDEGFKLEVVATATNATGAAVSQTSAATAAVLDAAPTVTTPVITGTAQEGQTLTASASAGQSDNAVSYQWMENSGSGGSYQNIAGATAATIWSRRPTRVSRSRSSPPPPTTTAPPCRRPAPLPPRSWMRRRP